MLISVGVQSYMVCIVCFLQSKAALTSITKLVAAARLADKIYITGVKKLQELRALGLLETIGQERLVSILVHMCVGILVHLCVGLCTYRSKCCCYRTRLKML